MDSKLKTGMTLYIYNKVSKQKIFPLIVFCLIQFNTYYIPYGIMHLSLKELINVIDGHQLCHVFTKDEVNIFIEFLCVK